MSNTVALTFTSQANGLISHLNQKWVGTNLTLVNSVADAIQFAHQLKQENIHRFNVLQMEIKRHFPLMAKWYF